MRYLAVVLLLALCAFKGAQKEKDYSGLLPGVVKVNDHLYYGKTEVTNGMWKAYRQWVGEKLGEDSPAYLRTALDTSAWLDRKGFEPYAKHYHRHEAYANYPVVGITWTQASEYCAWRTEWVRQKLAEEGKLEKAPAHFQYRLPTYGDWHSMYQTIEHLPNRIGEEGPRRWRGKFRYTLKRGPEAQPADAGKLNDNAAVTAPVESYWSNDLGVFNIKGNVSEWLLEQDVHVGGGWSTPEEEDVSVRKTMKGVSSAVGFRCVCEVAEEAP